MTRFVRPIITLALGLILALVSAAVTYSAPPAIDGNLQAAARFMQATSTPGPADLSTVGSTDGIVTMGILIALIVIIPILLRRQSWMENS